MSARAMKDRATRSCRRPTPRWPDPHRRPRRRGSIRVCAQNWCRCKGGPEKPILEAEIALSRREPNAGARGHPEIIRMKGWWRSFRNPASSSRAFPLAALPEAIIIRKALEETTARLAAERATSSQILGLHSVLGASARGQRCRDRERFTRPTKRFTPPSPMSRTYASGS